MGTLLRNTVVFGTKTDIWRVENVGAGTFQRGVSCVASLSSCDRRVSNKIDRAQNDGTEFLTFKGEVRISDEVKVGSFRAGGLSVRVCS